MKKSFKKLGCLLLSLFLVFACAAFAFAEEPAQKTPIVLIPGFGQSETAVYDDSGEYLGNINSFTLPGLDAMSIVKKVLAPVLASAVTKTDLGLTKAVESALEDVFKPFLLNNDGTPVYHKVVEQYPAAFSDLPEDARTTVQHHISLDGLDEYNDVRYYYTYDSFGSIEEAGEGLYRYLTDVVLKQTGAEKVILVPVSQGGTVLTEFLALHPEAESMISKIICMIPAFDGAQILGDVMTDRVKIYDVNYDHETVLPALLSGDLPYQISLALRAALTGKQLQKVLAAALEKVRQMLVVNSTSMWALVPAADYAAVKDKYLGDGQHEKVLAECEFYDAARAALPATLHKFQDDGISIQLVSCYDVGNMFPFLFGSGNINTDDLLTPASSALGATYANLGETLGDDYVCQGTHCDDPAHNHLSPDRMIDASTCEFPENTWFFKGVSHTQVNLRNDVKDFAAQLILNDDIKDIYTYPGCDSQFLDPHDAIVSTYDSVDENGNTVHNYYSASGRYLFSETEKADGTGSSFWKTLATFTNRIFRFFDDLKARLGLPV